MSNLKLDQNNTANNITKDWKIYIPYLYKGNKIIKQMKKKIKRVKEEITHLKLIIIENKR